MRSTEMLAEIEVIWKTGYEKLSQNYTHPHHKSLHLKHKSPS